MLGDDKGDEASPERELGRCPWCLLGRGRGRGGKVPFCTIRTLLPPFPRAEPDDLSDEMSASGTNGGGLSGGYSSSPVPVPPGSAAPQLDARLKALPPFWREPGLVLGLPWPSGLVKPVSPPPTPTQAAATCSPRVGLAAAVASSGRAMVAMPPPCPPPPSSAVVVAAAPPPTRCMAPLLTLCHVRSRLLASLSLSGLLSMPRGNRSPWASRWSEMRATAFS